MARRHWLDPLARRLLAASGQLPSSHPQAQTRQPDPAPQAHQPERDVERELVALKLRQSPNAPLSSALHVQLAAELGWRLDVNRATTTDWRRLPGLTTEQLDLLLRLQAGGVQLCGPEDLQRLLDLSPEQLQSWLPVLDFRWYGDAPPDRLSAPRLDLNRAGNDQLRALGLPAERIDQLQRERGRQPFRDLADLQQRLQLPADLVERWIGKVCFGGAPPGPVLPPRLKQP